MDASVDVVGPPAGGVGGVGGVKSHLCTVLFEWVFSRIRRSRRSTSFELTELEEYSGCPLLRRDARSSIGLAYAKNLERGEGGVCLNWILKKLLSRLSVFSGVCTPSFFFFVSRRRPLRLPFCLAGARRQHAQRRGGQGPQHHFVAGAVAVWIAAFPLLPLSRRCCSRRRLSQVVKSHMPVTKVFSVVDASGDVVGPPAGGVGGVGGVKSHLCTVLF